MKYKYSGPIKRFGRIVKPDWEAYTNAPTLEKAINNLKYQAKKYMKLTRDAKVELNNSKVVPVEEEEKLIETSKKPTDLLILANNLDLLANYSKEELKDLLIDVINAREGISDDDKNAIALDDLYMELDSRLNSFKDNFCTLIPGLPKLKRGDKRFNQNSKYANLKDSQSLTSKEKEMLDYVINNFDHENSPEEALKLMKIYYSAYQELAYRKAEECLDYLRENMSYSFKDSDTFDIMIEDISTGERKLLKNRTYSMLERLERNKNIRIISTTPSDNEDLMDSKFRDVYPKRNESKGEFISRFMRETKEEYPDYKQRLAVAYSYWDRSKK